MRQIKFKKYLFKYLFKYIPAGTLLLGMMVFNACPTSAFLNDTESSRGNLFAAALLDFRLTESSFEGLIGEEYKGEKNTATVALPVPGSLGMQYTVHASSSPLCGHFTVRAEKNEVLAHSGSISDFHVSTSTEFGTFDFEFDLPVGAGVTHGDLCQAEFIFYSWRQDVVAPEQSGFDDVEIFSFELKAKTIVLNEIFPRPFAAANAPLDREYIELYNNGSMPVEISGWKIIEMTAGGSETSHSIVSSGATGSQLQPFDGVSVIAPGGFLVLVFGGSSSYLNDGGDIVKLIDASNTLVDSHEYPNTAIGKSHSRIPDGIGNWVDPVPTPGGPNVLSDLTEPEIIEEVPSPCEGKGDTIVRGEVLEVEIATTTFEILPEATTTEEMATSTEEVATSTEEITPPIARSPEQEESEDEVLEEPAIIETEPALEPVQIPVEIPEPEPAISEEI